jgi:acetyl/propionyl-CoA carboxylase alpha subunit
VEFLVDARRNCYFLEMNTRLQVEHPITEETLGLDLVRSQIEVAEGATLPAEWRAGKLRPRGHAMELRLYAEDPVTFLPRSGRVLAWEPPAGPGVRVDAGVDEGSEIGLDYDPLVAKLVVFAPDRAACLSRARRALHDWVVLGVETNAPLLTSILSAEAFAAGKYATNLISRMPAVPSHPVPEAAWIAAALAFSDAKPSARGAAPSEPWGDSGGWRSGR